MFVNLGLFGHFETDTNIRTWIKSHHRQILKNGSRCNCFEARVHTTKDTTKNSRTQYQDGLGRTTIY